MDASIKSIMGNSFAGGEESDSDDNRFKQNLDEDQKNSMDRMGLFRDNYGESLNIPSYNVLDAKIWPCDSDYFLQVVRYQIPENIQLRTFNEGQSQPDLQSIKEEFPAEEYDVARLKLMKIKDQVLTEVLETPLPVNGAKKAKIQFSGDGKYLALLVKDVTLKIYQINEDEGGLEALIQEMEDKNDVTFQQFGGKKGQCIHGQKKMEFDFHSLLLTTLGKTSMNIIPLSQGSAHVQSFEIFKEKYSKILDVNCVADKDMDLEGDQSFSGMFENDFRCEIACKSKQENCIEILGVSYSNSKGRLVLKDAAEVNDKKIYYQKETPDMSVQISNDFEKVILVNQDENYILERQKKKEDSDQEEDVEPDSDEDMEKWHQNSLTWLKGKRVRMIREKSKGQKFKNFMLVVCQDYDNQITIMSSQNRKHEQENWKLSIKRGIEPGSLKMFDMYLEKIENRMAQKCTILSQRDEELYIDITNNENQEIIAKHMFSKYRAFCPYWPFFGFQGLESNKNYFWLIDVNEPKMIDGKIVINRIQIPDHEGIKVNNLSQAFITETKNLFIVCNSAEHYLIFQVSLDDGFEQGYQNQQRDMKAEFVWMYHEDDVDKTSLIDIHVRDSSEKDNKKLMMFFLHEGCLYYYTKGEPKLEKMFQTLQKQIAKISDNAFAIRYDEPDENHIEKFCIKQVNIEFGQCSTENIYQEKLKSKKNSIEGFGYDYKQNRLLILYQAKKRYSIKLLDTETNQQIWKQMVKNENLIGMIKSNLFILLDGHLYFDKNVIKIRFDLLNDNNDRDFNEDEVFDIYENVLNLKQDPNDQETVKTGMPITMKEYHKLVYIIKNENEYNKLLIMPYLHERKIYLSRQDEGDEYFYNSIEYEPHGREFNEKSKKQTLFISMNLTKYLVYAFQANGLLNTKINFSDEVKNYGKPKSVSPNGTVFIFQQKKDNKIHIMQLDIHNKEEYFRLIKTFDPIEMINQYLEKFKNAILPGDQVNQWFYKSIIDVYPDLLKQNNTEKSFSYNINDNHDITLKITRDKKQKKKFKEDLIKVEKERDQNPDDENLQQQFKDAFRKTKEQLIFIYNGRKPEQQILIAPIEEISAPQYTQRTQELFANGADGYTISNEYAFFWNVHSIWYLKLDEMPKITDPSFVQKQCVELPLFIDPKEKQTKVKKVRNGSKDEIIVLIVEQSPTSDSVIIWNLKDNREEEAFDMGKDPKVFWDGNGDPYLTEENKVVIGKQGVRLTCYDVDKINAIEHSKAKKFGWNVGHRFDSEHHSWAYLRDYLSLSFCYMTFVIKKRFDQDKDYAKDDYLFDREQYNYIINKRTAFTDTEENVADTDKLLFILKQFELIDKVMLEQLQYQTPEMEQGSSTALHLAYKQKNARSIKIILTYLAKLENTSSHPYYDIMADLIEYNGFTDYLWGLTFTTIQMENKQVLRVTSPYSSTIVSLAKSNLSYVDNHYFMDEMKEDSYIYDANLDEDGKLREGKASVPSDDYVSYPVRVEGLEVEWILEIHGRTFLQAVLNSQNLDLYDIPFIQIIIEYLYTMHKKKVMITIVPLYLFQLISFYTLAMLNELHYEETIVADEGQAAVEEGGTASTYMTLTRNGDKSEFLVFTFCAINVIINLLAVAYRLSKQITAAQVDIANLSHALVELVTIILNLSTTVMIVMESAGYQWGMDYRQYTRIVQACVSMLIWDRPIKYLQLVDGIAPYIVIFKTTLVHIRYFVPTLLIILFAFSNSFWLLGKNQLQFDKIPEGEEPLYSTSVYGSIKYMYLLTLGELSADAFDYEKGEASEFYWLWALFIIASFIVIIQLLNLLIALMGEPFAENSDVEQAKNSQQHLRFVMDHWNITDKEQKNMKYLITAFLNEEEDEDVELLEDIQEELNEMKSTTKKSHQDMMREIGKITHQVEKFITKMEEDADNEGENEEDEKNK